VNRRNFLKQIGIAGLMTAMGIKGQDKPEYMSFDPDCRAYKTYTNLVKFNSRWHPGSVERAIEAQRKPDEFTSGFVAFHGARAIRWLANQ
jgi:hypothetical protein